MDAIMPPLRFSVWSEYIDLVKMVVFSVLLKAPLVAVLMFAVPHVTDALHGWYVHDSYVIREGDLVTFLAFDLIAATDEGVNTRRVDNEGYIMEQATQHRFKAAGLTPDELAKDVSAYYMKNYEVEGLVSVLVQEARCCSRPIPEGNSHTKEQVEKLWRSE